MATWIAAHRKGIAGAVGFVGAGLTFLSAQTDLGSVSAYAGIILALLGAAGVYRVRNVDNKPAAGDQGHGAAQAGHPRVP